MSNNSNNMSSSQNNLSSNNLSNNRKSSSNISDTLYQKGQRCRRQFALFAGTEDAPYSKMSLEQEAHKKVK